MILLLDTNALLWILNNADGGYLGKGAKEMIQQAHMVYVSSIIILGNQIKTMLGKLESSSNLLVDILTAGLKSLSFSTKQSLALKNFPVLRKHDPFDQMLLIF